MSKNTLVFIALIAMSPVFLVVWLTLCLGTERIITQVL